MTLRPTANQRSDLTGGGSVFARAPPVDLIVTSTLTRAIETAFLGFGAAAAAGAPPYVATELCRERVADYTCDGRRPLSTLRAAFPGVDFSEVEAEEDAMWLHKEVADGEASCRRRALRFVEWLLGRPERTIAVVSHSHFLLHLMALFPPAALHGPS